MADFILFLSDDPLGFSSPEKSTPSIGILYLASSLESMGFSVLVKDLRTCGEEKRIFIKNMISEHSPKAIGISSLTFPYNNAKETCRIIKEISRDIIVIAGGIHATFLPEQVLSDGFDVVVRGEGEETITELAEAIKNGKAFLGIEGISFKDNGKIIHNPDRPLMNNIDKIHFPAWHLVNFENYLPDQRYIIVTSRGCPFRCIYCSCGTFSKHKWRARSPENVLEEIKLLVNRYGAKKLKFLDDTFTLDKDRAMKICRLILKENLGIEWACFSRVDTIDFELLKLMKVAGCVSIQFGVESGNQKVLDSIYKEISLEQVEKAVKLAKKNGIKDIICSFIIGHPEDTEDTIVDTVEFANRLKKLGATTIPVSMLIPFPGSDVWTNRKRYGIKIFAREWRDFDFERCIIETKNLSRDRIEALYYDFVLPFINSEKIISASQNH